MLTPPIEPMLASPLAGGLPEDTTGLSFEPKWDGFRCLVFRDADSGVVLQGRGRSSSPGEVVDLAYAFPELIEPVLAQLAPGSVIDAEIVVPHEGRLDFGVLSSRLRPRSEAGGTNIHRLSTERPALLLAFDVLWHDGDRMALPFHERRGILEDLGRGWTAPLLLTPSTRERAVAIDWFTRFESAGVDGLIVKPLDDAYVPGKRTQGKVKHQRTADVVLAGWRPHARPGPDGAPVVGSLLLGLHDSDGVLQYVGAASAFTAAVRAQLVDLLAPLEADADDGHPWRDGRASAVPGEANRWKKEQPWTAVRPERVLEVSYDQMEGPRFRHVAGFQRWRPDRDPLSCGFDQLEVPPPADIIDLVTPPG